MKRSQDLMWALGVWCPYAEKYEFKLKKKTVVAVFKPRYNLERNYLNSLARLQ